MARPKRTRKMEVWQRDGWKCRYCHRPVAMPDGGDQFESMATVDHVVPLSKGGSNRKGNLVTACLACNAAKANHADWSYPFGAPKQRSPFAALKAGWRY